MAGRGGKVKTKTVGGVVRSASPFCSLIGLYHEEDPEDIFGKADQV
jgi:hypothetical protein